MNEYETTQKRGERLAKKISFLGCGVHRFEKTGRTQLGVLIRHGLNPWSRLLDIGCGALNGGYWAMHFLDPGCYFGIEPNKEMFEAGAEIIPEPDLFATKSPRFDHNDQYDFSVFGVEFDFFYAHPRPQIESCGCPDFLVDVLIFSQQKIRSLCDDYR